MWESQPPEVEGGGLETDAAFNQAGDLIETRGEGIRGIAGITGRRVRGAS